MTAAVTGSPRPTPDEIQAFMDALLVAHEETTQDELIVAGLAAAIAVHDRAQDPTEKWGIRVMGAHSVETLTPCADQKAAESMAKNVRHGEVVRRIGGGAWVVQP